MYIIKYSIQEIKTMELVEGNKNEARVLDGLNLQEDEEEGISLRSYDDDCESESDSSYLSYCSEQEMSNECGQILLELSQRTVNDEDCHSNNKMIEEFSTSEFQSSAEKQPQNNQKNGFNHNDITTFNQQQLTKYKAIEPSNQQLDKNFHDETLDLSKMLEMFDECQKIQRFTQEQQRTKQTDENIKKTEYEERNINANSTSSRGSPNTNRQNVKLLQEKPLIKEKNRKSYQLSFPSRQQNMIHMNSSPYYPLTKAHSTPFPTIKNQNKLEQFASENYLFWGVRISVKLSSFMSLAKNVLVVPFSNAQFNDPVSKIVNSKIKYNLKEILLKQAAKCNQKQVPNGKVFSVKAKGLESNYRGIYFVKTPQENISQGLKYYHTSLLKKSINSIFSLLDTHNQNHIIFPEFHWGSYTPRELSEILIGSIFREINQSRKSKKCGYLREVVICASNCELFELYLRYFRFFVGEMIP